MLKLVKWLAQDSVKLFGDIMSMDAARTAAFTPKNIKAIAHTQDASEYVGISFEDVSPPECIEINNIEENKYYFFYSPIDGNYLTRELVNLILKRERQKELDKLTITLSDGIILDANEDSQNRLSRAYGIMISTDTIPWKTFDNSFINITKAQIKEAILLAGQAQTALWIKYSL